MMSFLYRFDARAASLDSGRGVFFWSLFGIPGAVTKTILVVGGEVMYTLRGGEGHMVYPRPDYTVQREPKRLGDRLLEAGLITTTELETALERQREDAGRKLRIGRALVDLGFVTDRELTKLLSVHF